MQDAPEPTEILDAVARLLRETVMPELAGHTAFLVRVAANAVDLVGRQIELQPALEDAERKRLRELLGRDGTLDALNRALCAGIEDGSMTLETPGLVEHLWATTLAKLAVDQPKYSAYRRATGVS